MPTVDDVAQAAQVSRQTVSNVINSPEIVRETTRQRVQEAIDRLGYRPHASARRLRTRKSSTIGVRLDPLRDGISGAVLDRFVHKLAEQADARDLRVMIFTADGNADELAHIRRLRDGSDVDAFVLIGTDHGDSRIAWLVENRVPFVSFGRPWGAETPDPHHRWVDVDGRAGVRDAVRHLRANGADRVAWIGWPSPSGTGDERRAGWEESCGLEGADRVALAVATEDGVTEGRRAAAALLELPEPPDAIMCASDSLALGATMATQAAGLARLPIVGFDNTPVAAAVGLSSIEQPLDEVVAAALTLLFGEHGDDVQPNPDSDEEPGHRLLVPRLVERRSSHLALDGNPGA
ncbi:MAG: LacI family DNA-binding transcriptional regulator [Microcella sp.]|uniref:LacI family DNA-binding transcriptional regulator n=1 Tax=Microcella sp. TaxID=1913979 RepID=UPI00271F3075|nr:LacI family DNA-binding transcriptional regulator [Microcella sp.]MDO8337868.1 LacI family DNA-binding transcriptional regulator [Microcella sp.]